MALTSFKGTPTEYRMLHYWVQSKLGKPKECWNCGVTEAKSFDWANISREYKKDLSDWIRLCRLCHIRMDMSPTPVRGKIELNFCAAGHEYTPENTYIQPKYEWRACRICRAVYRKRYKIKNGLVKPKNEGSK